MWREYFAYLVDPEHVLGLGRSLLGRGIQAGGHGVHDRRRCQAVEQRMGDERCAGLSETMALDPLQGGRKMGGGKGQLCGGMGPARAGYRERSRV